MQIILPVFSVFTSMFLFVVPITVLPRRCWAREEVTAFQSALKAQCDCNDRRPWKTRLGLPVSMRSRRCPTGRCS